jgi:hypothetical protein
LLLLTGGLAVSAAHGRFTATIVPPATPAAPAAPAAPATTPDPAASITDAALEPWRVELLDEAFAVASMIPVPLHRKDRARAQQAVVTAMLELDQPVRVVPYINQIPTWRRGDAFADLAYHRAVRGDRTDALGFLALADRIALADTDWRRDRIRVNIARTHALLGREDVAAAMEEGVVASETGVVDAVRMQTLEDDRFEAQLAEFGRLVAGGGFDLTANVLDACVQLHARFYDQPERRERVHAFIVDSWRALPIDQRIARLMAMADTALAREDLAVARPLVQQATEMLAGVQLTAEFHVPLVAAVARRQAAAGDVGPANSALEAALARFDAERRTIIDLFRPEVLRPVAEAYVALGDDAAARRVYRLALDEGARNPNARPRAQDLSATLASMARHGLEPDAAMTARIDEIRTGLGAPW